MMKLLYWTKWFHLQKDYVLPSSLGLGESDTHSLRSINLNKYKFTCMAIMKTDWNNRLIAYPFVTQKNILKIDDIISMAQTSTEKLPI